MLHTISYCVSSMFQNNNPNGDIREVITDMVNLLTERPNATISAEMVEDVVEAVLQYEAKGSTGIGRGMAVPQAYTAAVVEPTVALAVLKHGASFKSPDDCPVRLVVLILSPPGGNAAHIETLARTLTATHSTFFSKDLLGCATEPALHQLITKYYEAFNKR